jgi:uncharacterized membrane protein YcaP (DUF421 family)
MSVQQIASFDELARAILDSNGMISFIKKF